MVARRKKFVVTSVVLLVAAALLTFARDRIRDAVFFALLSSPEKKLVGEWKTYSIGGVIVTTLRPDHTWTSVGGCLDVTLDGRWTVDGSDIVYSFDLPAIDDEPAPKPVRAPIHQLINDDRVVRSWPDHITEK